MRLLLRAGLVLGLVIATACSTDAVGPKSLANPQATTAQMQDLDTLFNISALNSFSAMSGRISPAAPARVAALRALAAAANPLNRASALRPYARGVETAEMLRQLVPAVTTVSAAALFPPDVIGKTFEWNTTFSDYEATARAGAPSNGVRFILYAIDPLTGQPAAPLVEVGYVDLMDESSGTTAKLHVIVAGVSGSPVYADYTVAIESISATSGKVSVRGYITKGGPDVLNFQGSLTVSGNQTSASIVQDVSLDVDSRDLHIRLWEKVTLTQTTATLRIWFSVKHGTELVTLEGKFDINGTAQTVNGTITVKVDGGNFATCTVDASANSFTQTCQGADADGLNADEQEALHHIGDGIEHASTVLGEILAPPLNLLGAGF